MGQGTGDTLAASVAGVNCVTWEAAVAAWCIALRAAGRSEQTIGLRAYHVRRFGRDMRELGPWEVTGAVLETWFGMQDWSRETRRSFRSSLRGFYGWGVRSGRIESDVSVVLVPVKASEPRPRPAPEADYRQAVMLAAPRERLMLRLAAEAGLRRGEVCQVHRRDLIDDLTGWSLVVHGKGDKQRMVPLRDDLAILTRVACDAGGGFAFPGAIEGHLSAQRVGRLVSDLLPDGVTMHQLRHRFATRAYAVERDMFAVQDLLGHASPSTTRRYVAIDRGALRRAMLGAA